MLIEQDEINKECGPGTGVQPRIIKVKSGRGTCGEVCATTYHPSTIGVPGAIQDHIDHTVNIDGDHYKEIKKIETSWERAELITS